jgi:hypothetical protein
MFLKTSKQSEVLFKIIHFLQVFKMISRIFFKLA